MEIGARSWVGTQTSEWFLTLLSSLQVSYGWTELRLGGLNKQVVVIGHQYISVKAKMELIHRRSQKLNKLLSILVVSEDIFSLIAT